MPNASNISGSLTWNLTFFGLSMAIKRPHYKKIKGEGTNLGACSQWPQRVAN
jgi:hypothetical protein